MERPTWAGGTSGGVHSPETPSLARIRDYWLDGSHHTEADRDLAGQFIVCVPHMPFLVRAHRELLRRMVSYLVEAGVRQFLDLGTGLPTAGNVHSVAQAIEPDCRVLYVDIAPDVVAEGRELLSGNPNTDYVCADLLSPEQVLSAPERVRLINLDEPVAVLVFDMLHHIPDSERPRELLATYMAAASDGSYLGLSHLGEDQATIYGSSIFTSLYGPIPELNFREPKDLYPFFEDLPLEEPGVVPVPLWRPDEDPGPYPENFHGYAALGRKYA